MEARLRDGREARLLSVLDRHQTRRRLGAPVISCVVGPRASRRAFIEEWLAGHEAPRRAAVVAASVPDLGRALTETWLRAALERDLRVAALAHAAAALAVAPDTLAGVLAARSPWERRMALASLPDTPESALAAVLLEGCWPDGARGDRGAGLGGADGHAVDRAPDPASWSPLEAPGSGTLATAQASGRDRGASLTALAALLGEAAPALVLTLEDRADARGVLVPLGRFAERAPAIPLVLSAPARALDALRRAEPSRWTALLAAPITPQAPLAAASEASANAAPRRSARPAASSDSGAPRRSGRPAVSSASATPPARGIASKVTVLDEAERASGEAPDFDTERPAAPGAAPAGATRATLCARGFGPQVLAAFDEASRALAEDPAESPGDRARSAAERLLLALLEATPELAGEFAPNVRLTIRFGAGPAEIDLYARALDLAVEVDGYHHFRGPADYRRDRRKDLLLQKAGLLVVRVLAEDVVHDPEAVLALVLDAARHQRDRRPAPETRP